jgi:hypothetical protein
MFFEHRNELLVRLGYRCLVANEHCLHVRAAMLDHAMQLLMRSAGHGADPTSYLGARPAAARCVASLHSAWVAGAEEQPHAASSSC